MLVSFLSFALFFLRHQKPWPIFLFDVRISPYVRIDRVEVFDFPFPFSILCFELAEKKKKKWAFGNNLVFTGVQSKSSDSDSVS